MANTILTPTAVTREALRILHQKSTLIGSINRQYDASFAKSGAKTGDSLKIRLPNEYTVRSGRILAVQDTAETSTTLTVATQKGVDLNFTSAELTLSMDDFSKRILEPAMAVLAAAIEADVMNVYKSVYNQVDNIDATATFAKLLAGRKILNDNLVPNSARTALCTTQVIVDLVDANKALFHESAQVSKGFKEGMMGRAAGFDFVENTIVPIHTSGTAGTVSGYQLNGVPASGATSLVIDTGSLTFLAGDIITVAGVNSVHPETKVSTGILKQFVVTANSGGSATALAISPAMTTTGARQNCSALPADDALIVKHGAASATYGASMLYNEDFATFASADLVMPKGVDFASREVFDGISMRIVRAYDINNDMLPCRLDVLYGYLATRPQLCVRFANN